MKLSDIYLRLDLGKIWRGRDVFSTVEQIEGEVFRHKEGRRTLRFQLAGKSYFLKYHRGIGWLEIIKNVLLGRAPIISAKNEWQAVEFLAKHGIDTMTLAGYGERGLNPAAKQSFVITDDLSNTMSLEFLGEQWHKTPPTFATKKALIEKLATISKVMHEKGMNHRDFYLVHFLLDERFAEHNTFTADTPVFLIDLHRALINEDKPVKERWLVKDIGSLYFSAMDVPLTRRDLFRFIKTYSGKPLREALSTQRSFWQKVRQRAYKLRNADNAVVIESLTPIRSFLKGSKQLAVPFNVEMAGQHYTCDKVLRLLPKKRLVVEAHSDQHHAVIKLFSAEQKGRREVDREYDGYRTAKAAGVTVPEVLFAAGNQTGCLSIAYQYIDNAKTLLSLSAAERLAQLPALFAIVEKLHAYGAYQDDIHLDNFLLADGTLYLVDLGSVKQQQIGQGLSQRKSLQNLAHLVSEFSLEEQAALTPYIEQYYRKRHSEYNDTEKKVFAKYFKNAWQRRKRHYLKKQFRNCTMTRYQSSLSRQTAFRSDFLNGETDDFINDIEQLMADGQALKQGNSATVVKTEVGGKQIVIKRYNMKSTGHFVRRCLRPSRAAVSWCNANLLEFVGLPTVKPLGFIENRQFGLRQNAYFICEYVEAYELSSLYAQREPAESELEQIKVIFTTLEQEQISHGDLKASNFLLDEQGQVLLIDLDAMNGRHHCRYTFNKAFAEDKKRFMENWQNSALSEQFSFIEQ
jgi:heptose I phosphotransferase